VILPVPPKSYKEALLTPVKEVVEPRVKKEKKNRRKMANRGFPRGMDDRSRRDDRWEERNWDSRRSSGYGGGVSRGAIPARPSSPPRQSNQQWQRKFTQTSSSSTSMVNTNNSSQLIPTPEKSMICYKCDEEGHNSKECTLKVCCLVYEKDSHITRRCVWPNQPKPVMPAVGLADPDLGFFSAQQVKTEKKMVKDFTLGLIQVVRGHLTAASLYGGLIQQFQWQWTWKVVEKGNDFVVQFPSSEKLKMMMEFEEFRLKGTNAFIKVSNVNKKVLPVGRLFSVWARAEGVPDESKHYKGICEVGSLIGVVDDVDMQILSDLDVVRFQANVMSISKFPMVRRYVVKPWAYDITFSIEKVIEEGTIELSGSASMDVHQHGAGKNKENESKLDEDEDARASKKQKSSEANISQKVQQGMGTDGLDGASKANIAVLPSVEVHNGDVSKEVRP
jgi:hypothetical protein